MRPPCFKIHSVLRSLDISADVVFVNFGSMWLCAGLEYGHDYGFSSPSLWFVPVLWVS